MTAHWQPGDHWLASLGQNLGLNLQYDENRCCRLAIDPFGWLDIHCDDLQQQLVLSAIALDVDLDQPALFWRQLLRRNAKEAKLGRGFFGVDEEGDAILYHRVIPGNAPSFNEPSETMQRFVQDVEILRNGSSEKGIVVSQEAPLRTDYL